MEKKDFKKINNYLWEIPKSFKKGMRFPARIYIKEDMLSEIEPDAIEQVINVSHLPGIINYSLAMPDIHTGYGFVIGGVAAIDAEEGVISPGGVGFDINCGMKLLRSDIAEKDLKIYLDNLASEIQSQVPSGLGKGRKSEFSLEKIENILEGGAKKLVENGYGQKEDIENCEENGHLEEADINMVSDHAKNRGRDQVGTLGSGNHFCEVQKVDEIFDKNIAKIFGLSKNQIVIMIHTGSRGCGHQIATDYINKMVKTINKYNIDIPDKQLVACPFKSDQGQKYFKAMCAGANYAWANRQMIAYYIRKAWDKILGNSSKLKAVYDVAHNIAKIEEHDNRKVVIHRKGATRAFPPGSFEIPEKYQKVGQPVLIPGSMGTASYVLVGQKTGKDAWYSTSHGAGRTMSRTQAKKETRGEDTIKELKQKGIIVKSRSMKGIAEEAPLAYKDIDSVVETVHQAGLSKKVARLTPLAVIKGE